MYSRQIKMKEIGEEGQIKLAESSVLIIGCGGLGSAVLYYLTAMGVGHLCLCDNDTVALSNLNRQILYTYDDIGKPKVNIARERLNALNPGLKITLYDKPMDEMLAKKIIKDYDIIIECLDNFETRFIVNDICISSGKPLIHAGAEEFGGQMMMIIPGRGPCLQCLFPGGVNEKGLDVSSDTDINSEGSKKTFGVIGTTPGFMGILQATEAAKYLLGLQTYSNGLVTFDALTLCLDKVEIIPAADCICRNPV